MGLVIRSAEKLGYHRDGALLGLSPFQTEERRRLWWQLQHVDLALAVRSGLTPLTLMADWDTKMPLNIEDDDISASTTEFPKERKGLTSLSYCLYTYWVIDQQRLFFHSEKSRFELSWQSNKSLPLPLKESLINQLEDGLNQNFLQYCDPLKPPDVLLQLSARALICGMRMRSLHPLAYNGLQGHTSEGHRDALLTACMQSLDYNVAMHSQPSIRHPVMCVLVEAAQQDDASKTQRIWDLLSDLYSTNSTLSQLADDRRKFHAAELVVAAWKARQNNPNLDQHLSKPEFVTHLETQFPECRTGLAQNSSAKVVQDGSAGQRVEPVTPDSFLAEQDVDAVFDLDFQDIEWAFWSSID
ncbi:hypothetical protein H2198_007943 [Neophaeococcomyces mojaviensis]|uniref:Uncharacterized protein n=1 Tax=Neophaeococcomyces mojaviensis TaxID=3383035 RepID=A0ACC2ZYN9_9EURO|nr:hypothetical protein H2198_007943 [Knufia sp. JES_112]